MDTNDHQTPLEIAEILETVLLHLSQSNILQFQRVSRFWFNTISGSPSLQQKLFFQPLPPKKAAGTPPEFNPLARDLFPFLFAEHPCLGHHVCKNMADHQFQYWVGTPARREAVLRPEASWRRMLPLQPAAPIESVLVANWIDGDEYHESFLEQCEVDPSGHASTLQPNSNLGDNATMGLLYDITLHIFSSKRHFGIYVQWNMFRFTYGLEYDEDMYHTPRRWSLSYFDPLFDALSDIFFDQDFIDASYSKLRPRNTITIHISDVRCRPRCKSSVASTGLRRLLPLPDGVVRAGGKESRYPRANLLWSYSTLGRIAPGARSELDVERGQKLEPEQERDFGMQ